MKKKIIIIALICILLLPVFLMSACKKAIKVQPDTFTATYELPEKGRSISISGNSEGTPGQESQYILNITNNDEPWQDDYSVQLTANGSVIQEISPGRLNLHGNDGMQQPIMVKFPVGVEYPIGLSFVIPQRGPLLTVFLSITRPNDTNSVPTRVRQIN